MGSVVLKIRAEKKGVSLLILAVGREASPRQEKPVDLSLQVCGTNTSKSM